MQSVSGMYSHDITDYLWQLGLASCLEQGFEALSELVSQLGYDGVAYSAMPTSLGAPGLFKPVFMASSGFSQSFLSHYEEASLWKSDFTIERIQQGYMAPMDWGKELKGLQLTESQEQQIILAKTDYGIANAITIPTHSDIHLIAGASITSGESRGSFTRLQDAQLAKLHFAIHHFHQFVFSRNGVSHRFYQPLIDALTDSEKQVIAFIASGKPLKQSRHFTNLSPTRASNILSKLYRRLNVANASELCFLVGHHKIVEMF